MKYICLVNLVIAIAQVRGIENKAGSWFDCIPDISGSIGVTTPRGDVNLLHDSEPVDLYCHMSPDHAYFKKGYNSSHLSFIVNGRDKDRKIFMDRQEVESTVENSTTIKTKFNPVKVGHFDVSCRLKISKEDDISNINENEIEDFDTEDKEALTEKGVCTQRVHVGYPPKNVENFSCLSENWENLNCTWDEPYNPITTRYTLNFKEPGRRSPYRQCPNRTELERTLMRKIPLGLKTCYVDETTHPPYRKPMKKLLYLFNATNALLPSGSIMTAQIDHYAVVKPGAAQNLEIQSLPNNSIQFDYKITNQMRHFPSGLIQHVRYKSQWSDEWMLVDTSGWNLENNSFSVNLENLEFAWTNYTIQVKMLSGKGNVSDPTYWSKVSEKTGSTLPRKPQSAPKTHSGSFEVIGNREGRTVIVYWQRIEEKYHNGPNFGYDITQVLEGDNTQPILPSNQTSSYAEFKNLNIDNYTFFVTSKNEMGSAPIASSIFVPHKDKLTSIRPKSITKTYLEKNKTLEVAWFPPKDKSNIVSYTIFWCKFPNDRPYQCDGRLDWMDVKPYPENKTMIHKIPLPDGKNYQIAVSANTEDYSSGMVWSTCTIVENKIFSKVRDVSVDSLGPDFALIRWRLDCSDRPRVVVGYQIEYCALQAEHDEAISDCKTKNVTASDGEQIKILNLSPWTPYKIGVRVLTRGEPGELSDPVIKQTSPFLPGSKPLDIKISSTNQTASMQWAPPATPNGPIDFYQIKYWPHNRNNDVPMYHKVNETMLDLSDLLAYTIYTVNITACNVLVSKHLDGCSEFSSSTTFMTKRGKPGRPNEPDITFKNATIVDINWDSDFQLGAPEALFWNIKVSRAGEIWEENPNHDAKIQKVSGSAETFTLDLKNLHVEKDWSPNCENATNTNLFNFSIRAVIEDMDGREVVGLWSDPVTVPAYCKAPLPWLTVILVSIFVPLGATVTILGLCRGWAWWLKKKQFFDKLGRELDDKFISAPIDQVGSDKSKDYRMTNFGGKDGRKPSYSRADSKDSMETLLNNEKNQHESRTSDTTSGCESGQSSELGDEGVNRDRNDSFASEGRQNGNQAFTDDDKNDNSNEEMEEPVTVSFMQNVDPVKPQFSYVPTKNVLLENTWPARAKEAEHYTKFMPTVQTANYVGYSKVGSSPGTVVAQPTQPSLETCTGYVNSANLTANAAANAQPTPGYVTFSSVKLGEPEQKSTPGYITVDQVNKQSSADSKNPGLKSCDTTYPTKDQPFTTTIPPGYCRVGISPSSLSYIPNGRNNSEPVTNEYQNKPLDNSWSSDKQSKFKPSIGYVQAPLQNGGLRHEAKMDEFAEPLLITPRNLAVNSTSPYNEVISRFSEGAAASLV